MTEKTTLGNARGLNSIADPREFKGRAGRRRRAGAEPAPVADRGDRSPSTPSPPPPPPPSPEPEPEPPLEVSTEAAAGEPRPARRAAATPHRAVTPGSNRKRRELSVPHKIAEAVEQTGINPADIVMRGYRRHSDAIYAGEGGRMMARGRTRLRLSISDVEFDQLTRLGEARGWNRSETVSVILAMELLAPAPDGGVGAAVPPASG